MDRNTKTGLLVGAALAQRAAELEDGETRSLLHDLGEHLRFERSAAEAELTGPVLSGQRMRKMFSAETRSEELRKRVASLGALIKRIEFALNDVS